MNTRKVTHDPTVINAASNEELLRLVAERNENLSVAEQAFTEFYNRHRQYLYLRLCKVGSGWLDDDAKLDLLQETFIRVFEKAHTFKGKGLKDEVAERKWARAWLGTIATNLLRDWIRTRKEIRFENFDDDKIRVEAERKLHLTKYEQLQPSPKRSIMDKAIESLTARQQGILRIYGLYAEPGDKQLTIPDRELEELARNYNTSKENIRQIKHRAIKEIKTFIQLNAHQKGSDEES